MLPVIFTVANLPNQIDRLVVLENYDPKELILFCITVEVVALLDALEVLTKQKSRQTKHFLRARFTSILLLFCVIPKLALFSYWFAKLQAITQLPDQAHSANVVISFLLLIAFACALGCRSANILAELA